MMLETVLLTPSMSSIGVLEKKETSPVDVINSCA
jgi:hypothetical protein